MFVDNNGARPKISKPNAALGYGRFMQPDPIGYGDGLNWYNYAGSDPINWSDPTGLDATEPDIVRYGRRDPCAGICITDPNQIAQFMESQMPSIPGNQNQPDDIVVSATRPKPQKDTSKGFLTVLANSWCVAKALKLDIIPGVTSAQDVSDLFSVTGLVGSQPSILKEDVTGRRGTMRGVEGKLNPSGRFTSPLSAFARNAFGRNIGRAIGRGGSYALPVAAVGAKAYSMYEGLDDAQRCTK